MPPPSVTSPNTANAATSNQMQLNNKKSAFVSEQKPEINRRGPKTRLFRMPSNADICQILGVKVGGSDPLDQNDLTSASKTRMAIHRELIKRRPGAYSRRWLAQRVGVSRRTLNTYNALIPIHSRPQYLTTPINWRNIERLPLDEALKGAFIETLAGKRYPALRVIAAKLLAKGTFVQLKERTSNFYWWGSDEPPINPFIPLDQSQTQKQRTPEISITTRKPQIGFIGQETIVAVADTPRKTTGKGRGVPFAKITPPSKHDFTQPFEDTAQEALANHIYQTVNAISEQEKQLSLSNARRLAFTYTKAELTEGLKRIHERSPIKNPAGFLITLLRSDATRRL